VGSPGAARPAFYALSPGGWRDLVTIVHPPYTAWHLSYVAIGAALAPTFVLWRLGAALGAFFSRWVSPATPWMSWQVDRWERGCHERL
jgi:hypothetical protein